MIREATRSDVPVVESVLREAGLPSVGLAGDSCRLYVLEQGSRVCRLRL